MQWKILRESACFGMFLMFFSSICWMPFSLATCFTKSSNFSNHLTFLPPLSPGFIQLLSVDLLMPPEETGESKQ